VAYAVTRNSYRFFLVANPFHLARLVERFALAETRKMNVHQLTARREIVAGAPTTQPGAGPAAIAFEGVAKVYPGRKGVGEVTALSGIDLAVPDGSILGVIGRSGAGKSTLIRLVNGLETPSEGRVVVDGTVISQLGGQRLRQARRSIGMIFQHFNLLSSRTVFGNVALPLEIAGASKREIVERVEPLLELVGLADKRDRYPAELSGGQKQRVGIARALATRPKVLLSDEATSALDPETTKQILALIKRVNAELKLTVLLISHEMAVVKAIADRVAVLEDGRIVEQGATIDIFAHPRHPTTRAFVGTVTGAELPESLAALLKPEPVDGGKAVIRILFTGQYAGEPVLSRIARLLSVDLNILYGQVDAIGGRPFGVLVLAIPADGVTLPAAIRALERMDLAAEILGYVV
jgi:D-methionine transport system ATP-binding protein